MKTTTTVPGTYAGSTDSDALELDRVAFALGAPQVVRARRRQRARTRERLTRVASDALARGDRDSFALCAWLLEAVA